MPASCHTPLHGIFAESNVNILYALPSGYIYAQPDADTCVRRRKYLGFIPSPDFSLPPPLRELPLAAFPARLAPRAFSARLRAG